MNDAADLMRASLSRLREGQPYPGFRAFRRNEWPIFFGRERQVQALLALLAAHRFICIHGPSGGGKSSLIEAGLIATLEREHARLAIAWRTSTFRPGSSPLWNLARALLRALHPGEEPAIDAVVEAHSRLTRPGGSIAQLARQSGLTEGTNLLLVADQFEELFRFRAFGDPREAQRFVDLLLDVFDEQPQGIHLALAMRTDFLDDCSEVVGLAEAVNAAPFLTPVLTEDELRAAIRGPADLHGGKVEEALVEALLADSAGEPDRLPILQHTLMRCWALAARAGTPGQMTMELYRSDGIRSVRDALDRHAEEVMASPELAGLAREVELAFKALTDLDPQGRAIRRPLPWAQLCAETGHALPRDDQPSIDAPDERPTEARPATALERVVNCFRAEGTGFLGRPRPEETELKPETVVDVAHEALIRRWRRMSRPVTGAGTAGSRQREGWLWDLDFDSTQYRGLLARGKKDIISPDALDDMLDWWRRQPRNETWARRMACNRDATDQETKDDLARVNDIFRRSEQERGRWRLYRRLMWGGGIALALLIGIIGWQLIEKHTERAVAEEERAQGEANRQRLIVQLAENRRLREQLAVSQTTLKEVQAEYVQRPSIQPPLPTSSGVATPPAPPAPLDQSTEIAPSARPVAQSTVQQTAAAAGLSCKGAIWIGSNGAPNLSGTGSEAGRPVALDSIQAGDSFVSVKNLRLRRGLPKKEDYYHQDTIGTVPEGAIVVARGKPVEYQRPSGPQYWLEVGVSGQVCSLVYLQYAGGPPDSARRLDAALEKQGYIVPGQEFLSSAQGLSEVRYYWPEDRASAEQLAKDAMEDTKSLKLSGGRQITVSDLTKFARQKPPRGTLELWLDLSDRPAYAK